MVDYTLWPIIASYMIAIGLRTSEELCSQMITILKLHENVNVPQLLQKSLNSIGRILWSTKHHDQSSYQIWKNIRPMTSEELHSQMITIVKINENINVPQLLQKSTNQNGSIINLLNINEVWPTTSEELHSQSEDGRTSKHTERLYAPHIILCMA